MEKRQKLIIATGLIIGFFGASLVKFGNPANMGFCIACFLRDISGALKLHNAGVVQYIRPEIIGIVIGAFVAALRFKEFKTRGGSESVLRFLLGAFMMIGALVFLGCPLRGILRLAGGDLSAISGVVGFIVGVLIGTMYLKKGFSFGKPTRYETQASGWILPLMMIGLFFLLVLKPAFIALSIKGPGASYAPIYISLAAGLIVGFFAQRSGFCFAGGYRDMLISKNFQMASGYLAVFVSAFVFNLIFGQFKFGFADQYVAHTDQLWSFLGMVLVGLCATFLRGCPLRQLVKSADGNMDAVITVFGMIVGAAFSHNFGLASSPTGTTTNGQIAVIVGLIICVAVGYFFSESYRSRKNQQMNATKSA